MAGAPIGNSNARKGVENRIMFSTRLPPEVVEFIRDEANRMGIGQAEFLITTIKDLSTYYEQTER